jgi:hypothetical protein
MDYDFVLTENDEGIMAGGYIINDRLLISSMSGGKNKKQYNEEYDNNLTNKKDKLPKYSIPAGLFYVDIPHSEKSVKMMYNNSNELADNIYDSLYDNISISNNNSKIINNKNTKKRRKISNNKSKKQKQK